MYIYLQTGGGRPGYTINAFDLQISNTTIKSCHPRKIVILYHLTRSATCWLSFLEFSYHIHPTESRNRNGRRIESHHIRGHQSHSNWVHWFIGQFRTCRGWEDFLTIRLRNLVWSHPFFYCLRRIIWWIAYLSVCLSMFMIRSSTGSCGVGGANVRDKRRWRSTPGLLGIR